MTAEEFLNLYYCEVWKGYEQCDEPKITLTIDLKKRIDNRRILPVFSENWSPLEEPILVNGSWVFSIDDNKIIDKHKRNFLTNKLNQAGVVDFKAIDLPLPDITAYFTKPEPENPEN